MPFFRIVRIANGFTAVSGKGSICGLQCGIIFDVRPARHQAIQPSIVEEFCCAFIFLRMVIISTLVFIAKSNCAGGFPRCYLCFIKKETMSG